MLPDQIYPFSTQDGKAIPLDIIKSAGLIYADFTTEVISINIPANKSVGLLISSVDCLVRPSNTISEFVAGALYDDLLYVKANTVVATVLIPGTYFIRGVAASGRLYFQCIDKWAGLALDRQFNRK